MTVKISSIINVFVNFFFTNLITPNTIVNISNVIISTLNPINIIPNVPNKGTTVKAAINNPPYRLLFI